VNLIKFRFTISNNKYLDIVDLDKNNDTNYWHIYNILNEYNILSIWVVNCFIKEENLLRNKKDLIKLRMLIWVTKKI